MAMAVEHRASHDLVVVQVEAYYSLGHFMSKSDGWPSPVQNTEACEEPFCLDIGGQVLYLAVLVSKDTTN